MDDIVIMEETDRVLTGGAVSNQASKMVEQMKDALHPNMWTVGSILGVLIVILILGALIGAVKRIFWLVRVAVSCIILFELLHVISWSAVGETWTFMRVIFKYDVLEALAQLFVNTPLCDGFLWLKYYLDATVGTAFSRMWGWIMTWVGHIQAVRGR